MSPFPRCVALRSKHDNSYLHCSPDGGSLIELGSPEGGVMNPRCRFYLEPSEKHDGLIHVRCCYNNKYWVLQQLVLPGHGGTARWAIATAHEPEEDLSKPSCTLLKQIPVAGEQPEEDGSTCRFLHSKLGKYACAVSSTPCTSIRSYMHMASNLDGGADRQDSGLIDAFSVIDVSNQKQLPSHLAFKGDNGYFLVETTKKPEDIGGMKVLEFTGKDIGASNALHTIFTNDDGVVRIKSNYSGLFWASWQIFTAYQGIILACSDDTTDKNPDTLFRVTTGDDFIALRNLGSNLFCERHDPYAKGDLDILCDRADSITATARLQCYEPVLSREMYDVAFRMNEARVHTKGIDDLYSQTVRNQSPTTHKTTLTFTYTSTVETTWSSSVSMKLGVKTTIKTSIPFIVEGSIEISAEFSGSYSWGETKTEQKQISKQIEVEVPPMKKVTVKAIGSNGVCDIPFSYKQRDLLTNGEVVTKEFIDGMYNGVKTSDITFDIKEEDL